MGRSSVNTAYRERWGLRALRHGSLAKVVPELRRRTVSLYSVVGGVFPALKGTECIVFFCDELRVVPRYICVLFDLFFGQGTLFVFSRSLSISTLKTKGIYHEKRTPQNLFSCGI